MQTGTGSHGRIVPAVVVSNEALQGLAQVRPALEQPAIARNSLAVYSAVTMSLLWALWCLSTPFFRNSQVVPPPSVRSFT